MHLSLLVFEGDVQAHNVAVFKSAGQVTVAATVIQHQALNQLGLGRHLVLHVHQLNHVQVDRLVLPGNALDGIDNHFAEGVRQLRSNLSVKGSASNFDEEVTGNLSLVLESLKESERFGLSELHTFNQDTGMHVLAKIALGLPHKFTDEKHVRGCAVTDDIILSGGCTADHSSGGVLDLHLMEQNSSVFGQLDLACTANEPKIRRRFNYCSGKFQSALFLTLCILLRGD